MKLKTGFVIFILLFSQIASANMASPYYSGTLGGSAISSKDISIISEKIHIKIDPLFQSAKFVVEYYIQNEVTGYQVPLLFYAERYQSNFLAWMDGEPIDVQEVPSSFYESPLFQRFDETFNPETGSGKIQIYWNENEGFLYSYHDLMYFETDIEKGAHTIRIEYDAEVWYDKSDWIKEYSFRYSLSPAKYWKSFGGLEIIIEQEGEAQELITNLGQPNENSNSWKFDKLPADYFEVIFRPKVSKYANFLIKLSPMGITWIATILLGLLHFCLTIRYRKKNPEKKGNRVVTIGSFLIPILLIIVNISSYGFIDDAIGVHAGRYHGYMIFQILIYPVLVVIYLLVFWVIDRIYKGLLAKRKSG